MTVTLYLESLNLSLLLATDTEEKKKTMPAKEAMCLLSEEEISYV
jgi:hypothetical protein